MIPNLANIPSKLFVVLRRDNSPITKIIFIHDSLQRKMNLQCIMLSRLERVSVILEAHLQVSMTSSLPFFLPNWMVWRKLVKLVGGCSKPIFRLMCFPAIPQACTIHPLTTWLVAKRVQETKILHIVVISRLYYFLDVFLRLFKISKIRRLVSFSVYDKIF